MSHVVTVTDGQRSLALYVASPDVEKLHPERFAVDYIRQIDPSPAWRAVNIRDAQVGPVRDINGDDKEAA